MCGIFCSIINNCEHQRCNDCYCSQKLYEDNKKILANRGPDFNDHNTFSVDNYELFFAGFVLWLQGPHAIPQPAKLGDSCLLFNGDIFGGSVVTDEDREKNGDVIPLLHALDESKDVFATMNQVHGPFSFVYLKDRILYFGRDRFGRRSFLIGLQNGHLVLSSVLQNQAQFPCIELPAIGIFSIDLSKKSFNLIQLHTWTSTSVNESTKELIKDFQTKLKINLEITNEIHQENHSLFSKTNSQVLIESIDFSKKTEIEIFQRLLLEESWMKNVNTLQKLLTNSVRKRVLTQPFPWNQNVGILFSGGLDCTILAALAHQSLPPDVEIHLFNVAFENEKIDRYNTPDRLTGLASFEILQTLYKNRKWKFFAIDVTREELNYECDKRIKYLINPLTSILDESLGCALWFAARGKIGDCESNCRILLVGMGADELFGGYTRHRAVFRREHWQGLQKMLDNDWVQLPYRNLGRDDRVTADHGRQLRTPYLDEEFIEFVRRLDVAERCYPADKLVEGVGDKLLLRLLAHTLGLQSVATFKKRALQFGSRIANSKENAKSISKRLVL